ncbi:hypothetical protein PS623_03311 [Pseudomonas fluorescens]|nr:hypothetical protein PS623_03311 [Pseudomonas fluorescens]
MGKRAERELSIEALAAENLAGFHAVVLATECDKFDYILTRARPELLGRFTQSGKSAD